MKLVILITLRTLCEGISTCSRSVGGVMTLPLPEWSVSFFGRKYLVERGHRSLEQAAQGVSQGLPGEKPTPGLRHHPPGNDTHNRAKHLPPWQSF